MQARKRAKPVKFGRQVTRPVEKKEIPKVTQEKQEVVVTPVVTQNPISEPQETVETPPLADKLSDVPFIVDTPSGYQPKPASPSPEEAPVDSSVPQAPQTAMPEPEKKTKSSIFSILSGQPNPPSIPDATQLSEPTLPQPEAIAPAYPLSNPDGSTPNPLEPQIASQSSDPFKNPEILSSPANHKKGFLLSFMLIICVAFLVGLAFIAGGYYALHSNALSGLQSLKNVKVLSFLHNNQPSTQPRPTLVPIKPTKTVSPTQSVDLSSYSITVLNGSGETGLAAKVKSQLTSAGFSVNSIGNAPTSNNTSTQISANSSVPQAFLNKLKTTLSGYTFSPVTPLPSGTSSSTAVIVTLGTPGTP